MLARRLALPLIAAAASAAIVGAPALGDGRPAGDPMVESLRQQLVKERQQWDRMRQRLVAANRRLRAENRRLRAAVRKGGVTGPSAQLRTIAACESGGDPDAVSGGGRYRGKYQFDERTWRSVGGRGDPADAPEIEQDWRAHLLYERRGSQPWPVCG